MTYFFQAFNANSLENAKNIVLSPDPELPDKFQKETKFLVDCLTDNLSITDQTKILDFGCGMGRIARECITRFRCHVMGVDISASMLLYANYYVYPYLENFSTGHCYTKPNSIDVVLAILSLQHCQHPQQEIDNIKSVLKPQGQLVLLNENKRFVPSGIDSENFVVWDDDGFDIIEYCQQEFTLSHSVPYINDQIDIKFFNNNKKS